MEDEFNVDKLKAIFSTATGERTIEVTEDEYQKVLAEAVAKKLKIEEDEDSFTLKLDHVSIKITTDYDEEE